MPLKELRIHELPYILATERRATASAPPFYRTPGCGSGLSGTGGHAVIPAAEAGGCQLRGGAPRVKLVKIFFLVTASEVKVF